ncbi:MAG: Protein-export rane protein SecD [Frankiales bacterium]|nr:Protein-export rane protein SecD [Frankiales bacterium]
MDERQGRRSSLRFLVLVVAALVAGVGVLGYLAARPTNRSAQTRIVMTPVPGTSPVGLPGKLRDAATVLRLRLAALDKRVQVTVLNNTLVITAPEELGPQVKQLASPGQLEMRPVLGVTTAPGGCTVAAPTSGALDEASTACSPDGVITYALGPARLTGGSVSSAEATDAGSNRQIVIRLTALGRRLFTQLTRELSTKPAPINEVAVVLDGIALSAPQVRGVIVGDTQISGDFTSEQARALAVTIRYGGLPLAFAISEGGQP